VVQAVVPVSITGAGTFTAPVGSLAKPMPFPATAWSAEIGDVNGDGKPNIVAGALGIGVVVMINSES
jgi:hypothetical protein